MNESKCVKCGHVSNENKHKFGLTLCSVCYTFAPNSPEELDKYVEEKIPESFSKEMDKFRKYSSFRGESQKLGMIKKSSNGLHMSRVPFGYERDLHSHLGELIPAQNSHEVEEIFEEFANENKSLNEIAHKHKFSVNGLKKILRNFAYVGKIKFDGQIHSGKHRPIVSTTLFNHVQDKLDTLENKRKNTKIS